MKLVTLNEMGLPIPNPETRAIPVFREIMARVRRGQANKVKYEDGRDVALDQFLYIYYMCDYRSWAWQKHPDDLEQRHVDVIRVLKFDEKWRPDPVVQEAMEIYTELMEDMDVRMLRAALHAANATIEYFEGVNYALRDAKGAFLYTPKDVLNALNSIDSVKKNLTQQLRKIISPEEKQEGKVRGGGVVSHFENPDHKRLRSYAETRETIQRAEHDG